MRIADVPDFKTRQDTVTSTENSGNLSKKDVIPLSVDGEIIGYIVPNKNPKNVVIRLNLNPDELSVSQKFLYGPCVDASEIFIVKRPCDGPMVDKAIENYIKNVESQGTVLENGKLDWVTFVSHGIPGAILTDQYDLVLGTSPKIPIDPKASIPDGDSHPDSVFNPGRFTKNIWLVGCQILANQSGEPTESQKFFDALQSYCDQTGCNLIANSTPSYGAWGKGASQTLMDGGTEYADLQHQGPGGAPFRFRPNQPPQYVKIGSMARENNIMSEDDNTLPYDHIYNYAMTRASPYDAYYDMANEPMVKPEDTFFDGEILMPHHIPYESYKQ